MISSPTKLIRSNQPQQAEVQPRRTADRSKYKMLLDGTPAPDCIKCKEKKR